MPQLDWSNAVPVDEESNLDARDIQARSANPEIGKAPELDWASAIPVEEESGLLSGLGKSVAYGAKSALRSGEAAASNVTGDLSNVEKLREENIAAQSDRTLEAQRFSNRYNELNKQDAAGGEVGLLDAIGNGFKAIWDQPTGFVHAGAEQTANMIAPIAGMIGGGAVGGTIGGVVTGGNPLGILAGTYLGRWLGASAGNAALEIGGKAMDKAEGGLTPAEASEATREGTVKGGVIGAVDTATMGLSGAVMRKLSTPAVEAGAMAEARVLMNAGVDVTQPAQVVKALQDSTLRAATQKAGQEAASTAMTAGRNVAKGGVGLGLETVSEGIGEYTGELAATGKGNIADAVLESMMGMGQSSIETAYTYSKVDGNSLGVRGILNAGSSEEARSYFTELMNSDDGMGAVTNLTGAMDEFKSGSLDPLGLPNMAGPPLVTFPDGSTMTGAEAEQYRLDGTMQQTDLSGNPALAGAANLSAETNLSAIQQEEGTTELESIRPKTIAHQPTASYSDQALQDLLANPEIKATIARSIRTELDARRREQTPTQEGFGGTNAIEPTLGGTTYTTQPAATPATPSVQDGLQIMQTPYDQRVPANEQQLRILRDRIGEEQFNLLKRYAEGRGTLGFDERSAAEKLLSTNAATAPAAAPAVATQEAPVQQQILEDNETGQFSESREQIVARLTGGEAQFRTASEPVQMGERVGRTMRLALEQMGRLTGTEVVFYSSDSKGDGFAKDGNRIFINVKAGINPFQVMGHEATHVMKKRHPEAWKKVKEALDAGLGESRDTALQDFAKNYWTMHKDRLAILAEAGMDTALSAEQKKSLNIPSEFNSIGDFLIDEMISDLGGERWTDQDFWTDVFDRIEAEHGSEKAKGIVSRLVNAIKLLLTQFSKSLDKFGKFSTESDLAKNVTPEQIDAIRDAIAGAYAQWISADRTTEPEGYNRAERAARTTAAPMADAEKPKNLREAQAAYQGRNATANEIEALEAGDEVRETPSRQDFKNQTLPTRWPTSKKVTPSVDDMMITDFATLKQDQAQYAKAVKAILEEPGMHSPDIATGTLDEKADHVIERMKLNLLWLYDQIPMAIRERSKLWYDGARKISEYWADKYDISESQAAGALAVLSPQKDWFMNVTMAERVLDIVHTKLDHTFDAKMDASAFGFLTKESIKEDPDSQKNLKAYEAVKGKTLREVAKHHDLRQMSIWIRAYDEAYHDPKHAIVTPEGGFVEDKTTMKGEPTLRAWGDFNTPGKAASIYFNGTPENINKMLGGEHKVRNFYNNIFAPADSRFTTIDTHAVAAGMLRALAGADKPVAENFGKTGGTNVTGLSGTYALHYEAYRRAAEERDVLPREMQSITWEAIRGLFTEGFKGKKDNVAAVDAVWKEVDAGNITARQARNRIRTLAGGITNPDWWQEDNAEYKAVLRDKTYVQERGIFHGSKVTFEVAPDPRNNVLKARWDSLSQDAKNDISHKVTWKIAAKALASFGDENMKGELHKQLGGWLDDTNPSLSIWFNKRAAASKISEFARMLGFALNQMSMMRTSQRPFKGMDGKTVAKSGAIGIDLPKNADVNLLYRKIRGIVDSKGKPYVSGHTTSPEQMVIIHTDIERISTEELGNKINAALNDEYVMHTGHIYAEFPSKGKNNYALPPRNAKDSPESSLRARSDQLRAEAGVLIDQLIGEYETKPDAAGSELARASTGRRNREEAINGVEGVHYSVAKRDSLSSAFFGKGLNAAELERVMSSDDDRIKQRIYFYINGGRGINPESGVGAHAHRATLDNLYDIDNDPKDFALEPDKNQLESDILDGGYDGYISNSRGVAILLGPRTVEVEYAGIGKQTATPAGQAKRSAYGALSASVMESKGLPSGQMSGAAWKRIMASLMPDVDVSHLDPEKDYYRDQIIAKPARKGDNPNLVGLRTPIKKTAPSGAVLAFSESRILDQVAGKTITRQVTISETGETVQVKNQDAAEAIRQLRRDIQALDALKICVGA